MRLKRLARAVAQRRQVGDQADVPEQERDGDVGGDREEVPHQRAAPLRPQVHRVGIGREPVEEPRPAEVQDREQPGHRHREQRHRLGEAVDRRAPLLPQQQQDRRDEGAGVADADPPDEVGDREAPGDRDVDAPDADAADEAGRRSRRRAPACRPSVTPKASSQRQPSGRVRTRSAILSVMLRVAPAGAQHADVGGDSARACVTARPWRRRIATPREVGRARPRVELAEHRVVARRRLRADDVAVGVVEVAEVDRLRRARRLAGGDDVAVGDRPRPPPRRAMRARATAAARSRCTSPSRRAGAP